MRFAMANGGTYLEAGDGRTHLRPPETDYRQFGYLQTGSADQRRGKWEATMKSCWACILASLLCGLSGGCGPGQPPLYPVSGHVSFQRRPAEGFAVEFSSQHDTTRGISAMGIVDRDGRFILQTRQQGRQRPGAVAGPHRVVVLPPPAFGDEGVELLPIPLRYADYSKSGLTATVTEGQQNDFVFALTP